MMNYPIWLDGLYELMKIILPLVICGYFGYRLGLQAKKPIVVVDYIKIEEKRTFVELKNIGESAAVNVVIGDCIVKSQDKPTEPYNEQLKGKEPIFKFDRINYIEPGKSAQANVSAMINGKLISNEGLFFFAHSLHSYMNADLVYKDNFGNSYRTKIEKVDIK